MPSFHELAWPTKAFSAGAAVLFLLSLTGCPTADSVNGTGSNGSSAVVADPGPVLSDFRVFFDYDSAELRPDALGTLDAVAAWLAQNPQVNATIEGHCDERGTREYNLALGERRAAAVASYLAAAGVDPARLQTVSYGKERPAVVGSDETAWAQNRRAAFVRVN
jgi:peptidoglycan-associated lipoprotein